MGPPLTPQGVRGALIGTPTTGSFVEVCVVALTTRTPAQRKGRLSCSAAPPLHTLEEKQNWGGKWEKEGEIESGDQEKERGYLVSERTHTEETEEGNKKA